MNIVDHLGLTVSDFGRSVRFYEQALAPLGISVVMTVTKEMSGGYEGAGFGLPGKPSFWVGAGGREGKAGPVTAGLHFAFVAESRAAVDAFHAAAIAAGGTDNGKPGLRPEYHPGYYGAFVLDPDGNNVEAVSHRPE